MTRSTLTDQLVADCSADMRHAYAAILRKNIDDLTWAHATLPQREGGFGLRVPRTTVDTARLVSLVNVSQRALGCGATKSHIDTEAENAIANHVTKLGTGLRPDLVRTQLVIQMAGSGTERVAGSGRGMAGIVRGVARGDRR